MGRVRFSKWVFDRNSRALCAGSRPVHISPKAFDLLGLLITRHPDAVSKTHILQSLWPATFVSESNVTKLITEVRTALSDDARRPRYVRTIHRYGYAFVADVVREGAEHSDRRALARARLVWNGRALALAEGTYELGRTEEADVQIDAPTISRLHARIIVEDARAILEDLGSKNGTFLRGERVTTPVELRYGDVLFLGSEPLTFERPTGAQTTETGGPG